MDRAHTNVDTKTKYKLSLIHVTALEHLLDLASTHPAQIGRKRDNLAGPASVLRKHYLPATVNRGEGVEEIDEDRGRRSPRVVDIVGTGGNGHDTFNASTTSAIVAAGADARVVTR